jgi:hypothetical protein
MQSVLINVINNHHQANTECNRSKSNRVIKKDAAILMYQKIWKKANIIFLYMRRYGQGLNIA